MLSRQLFNSLKTQTVLCVLNKTKRTPYKKQQHEKAKFPLRNDKTALYAKTKKKHSQRTSKAVFASFKRGVGPATLDWKLEARRPGTDVKDVIRALAVHGSRRLEFLQQPGHGVHSGALAAMGGETGP